MKHLKHRPCSRSSRRSRVLGLLAGERRIVCRIGCQKESWAWPERGAVWIASVRMRLWRGSDPFFLPCHTPVALVVALLVPVCAFHRLFVVSSQQQSHESPVLSCPVRARPNNNNNNNNTTDFSTIAEVAA